MNAKNITILEGTVLAVSSHELAATPAKGKQKARPARTMGVICLMTTAGEYVEVTDFGPQHKSIQMDTTWRLICDRQERKRGDADVVYHNLVRGAAIAPVDARQVAPA